MSARRSKRTLNLRNWCSQLNVRPRTSSDFLTMNRVTLCRVTWRTLFQAEHLFEEGEWRGVRLRPRGLSDSSAMNSTHENSNCCVSAASSW